LNIGVLGAAVPWCGVASPDGVPGTIAAPFGPVGVPGIRAAPGRAKDPGIPPNAGALPY